MSSLAQQLSAIAGNVDIKSINKGIRQSVPSLLFTKNDAKTISLASFYDIGRTGILSLCSADPVFTDFVDNLFSDENLHYDRNTAEKEIREHYDTLVNQFIMRSIPYFLSPSCHQCLEWLFRRFDVANFAGTLMLLAYLPFSETDIYAKLISTLDLSFQAPIFNFMKSSIEQEIAVPRAAIIRAISRDISVLRLITTFYESLLKSIGPHSLYMSFLSALITETIEFVESGDNRKRIVNINTLFTPVASLAFFTCDHCTSNEEATFALILLVRLLHKLPGISAEFFLQSTRKLARIVPVVQGPYFTLLVLLLVFKLDEELAPLSLLREIYSAINIDSINYQNPEMLNRFIRSVFNAMLINFEAQDFDFVAKLLTVKGALLVDYPHTQQIMSLLFSTNDVAVLRGASSFFGEELGHFVPTFVSQFNQQERQNFHNFVVESGLAHLLPSNEGLSLGSQLMSANPQLRLQALQEIDSINKNISKSNKNDIINVLSIVFMNLIDNTQETDEILPRILALEPPKDLLQEILSKIKITENNISLVYKAYQQLLDYENATFTPGKLYDNTVPSLRVYFAEFVFSEKISEEFFAEISSQNLDSLLNLLQIDEELFGIIVIALSLRVHNDTSFASQALAFIDRYIKLHSFKIKATSLAQINDMVMAINRDTLIALSKSQDFSSAEKALIGLCFMIIPLSPFDLSPILISCVESQAIEIASVLVNSALRIFSSASEFKKWIFVDFIQILNSNSTLLNKFLSHQLSILKKNDCFFNTFKDEAALLFLSTQNLDCKHRNFMISFADKLLSGGYKKKGLLLEVIKLPRGDMTYILPKIDKNLSNGLMKCFVDLAVNVGIAGCLVSRLSALFCVPTFVDANSINQLAPILATENADFLTKKIFTATQTIKFDFLNMMNYVLCAPTENSIKMISQVSINNKVELSQQILKKCVEVAEICDEGVRTHLFNFLVVSNFSGSSAAAVLSEIASLWFISVLAEKTDSINNGAVLANKFKELINDNSAFYILKSIAALLRSASISLNDLSAWNLTDFVDFCASKRKDVAIASYDLILTIIPCLEDSELTHLLLEKIEFCVFCPEVLNFYSRCLVSSVSNTGELADVYVAVIASLENLDEEFVIPLLSALTQETPDESQTLAMISPLFAAYSNIVDLAVIPPLITNLKIMSQASLLEGLLRISYGEVNGIEATLDILRDEAFRAFILNFVREFLVDSPYLKAFHFSSVNAEVLKRKNHMRECHTRMLTYLIRILENSEESSKVLKAARKLITVIGPLLNAVDFCRAINALLEDQDLSVRARALLAFKQRLIEDGPILVSAIGSPSKYIKNGCITEDEENVIARTGFTHQDAVQSLESYFETLNSLEKFLSQDSEKQLILGSLSVLESFFQYFLAYIEKPQDLLRRVLVFVDGINSISASALRALSFAVKSIKLGFIPLVSPSLKAFVSLASQVFRGENSSLIEVEIKHSSLQFIETLLFELHQFAAPFFAQIFLLLLDLNLDEICKKHTQNIFGIFGTMPLRGIYSAFSSIAPQLQSFNSMNIQIFLRNFVLPVCNQNQPPAATSFVPKMLKSLLALLDLRRCDVAEIEIIEGLVVKSYSKLFSSANEEQRGAMLRSVISWVSVPSENIVEDDELAMAMNEEADKLSTQRVASAVHLISALFRDHSEIMAKEFRGLLDAILATLDYSVFDSIDAKQLLPLTKFYGLLLKSFTKKSGFISEENFENSIELYFKLLSVDAVLKSDELTDNLIPGIVALCRDLSLAHGVESARNCWKLVVVDLITHLRSENDMEVLLGLVLCQELLSGINVDFLAFLPEILPFLRELSDHENSTIRLRLKLLMKVFDEVSGERISKEVF